MPAGSLPEMAAVLLEALRGVQPQGPYCLAGWSLGGVLAYEMAQQLTRAGEKVALLALIDSYPPALLRQLEVAAAGEGDPAAHWRQAFAQDLAALAGSGATMPAEQEEHLFRIFQAHAKALAAYDPEVYTGPVALFACAGPGSDEQVRAWGALARGGLAVSELPGDHYAILRDPAVARLAECLAAGLSDGGGFAK